MALIFLKIILINQQVKILCYLQSEKIVVESLLQKINTCLQKTTTCNELGAEQIFSVNI